jgi:hypothetical protein
MRTTALDSPHHAAFPPLIRSLAARIFALQAGAGYPVALQSEILKKRGAMPTRRKRVILPGTLRSADCQRQRPCQIKVQRQEHYVDELLEPTQITYSRPSIYDSDDWPDGDYEVAFGGQQELLTKERGRYGARRGR